MSKRYCSSCGTPNGYIDGVAPKFCGKCGKALQFVPLEKSASQASKSSEEVVGDKDLSDKINKLVMQKLNALLSNGGNLKKVDEDGNNDEENTSSNGEIPIPSADDAIVSSPKFMTIAELRALDAPIKRGESPRKFNDYST